MSEYFIFFVSISDKHNPQWGSPDIEGVFVNTSHNSVKNAMMARGINRTIAS